MIERESVFSRWSRRKQQSQQENVEEDQLIEQQLEPEAAEPHPLSESSEEEQDVPTLTDEDMPDIDSLHSDSDFSPFMSPGVSEELRNLALRKLFRSEVFNICDGLDEYDEDYTSFEALGNIVTCDMKHQLEVEAQKKLDQEATENSDNHDLLESQDEIEAADTSDIQPPHQAQTAQQDTESAAPEQSGENTYEQATN